MRLIAHRGFADEAPENTLAALEHAASSGADVMELDVRRCASGEVVVHHDETVDRVTDGSGRVADLTRQELAGLDVLGSGEGVPTLANVLESVPDSLALNVECKEVGVAAEVAEMLAAHDGDAMVSSFERDALAEARDAAPSVPTAFLTDSLRNQPVATAVEFDCDYVHPHYFLPLLSKLVPRAHDAGIEVNVWTVRSPSIVRLLGLRGVDGIVSDRSDVL
ncbi:glycerophosphodiester phosphodiesterase family protein [Haloarchaeobius sp. FL176]|uniref:glycerophosphodiester phosphodiesterase n=1 Tax=Haloarchaeobius sp. FL176 TaxID=2967129 RepID=UPI00214950C1